MRKCKCGDPVAPTFYGCSYRAAVAATLGMCVRCYELVREREAVERRKQDDERRLRAHGKLP